MTQSWRQFFLSVILFSSLSFVALAQNSSQGGLAVVRLTAHRKTWELTQAIVFKNDQITFYTIDEIGSVPFVISFDRDHLVLSGALGNRQTESSKLKRLLDLPLKAEEFSSLIKHTPINSIRKIVASDQECWHHDKQKELQACYGDFTKREDGSLFPKQLKISTRKNSFSITWQTLPNF